MNIDESQLIGTGALGNRNVVQQDPTADFNPSLLYHFLNVSSWLTTVLTYVVIGVGAWQIHYGLGILVLGWFGRDLASMVLALQQQIGQRDFQAHVAAKQEAFARQQDQAMRDYAKQMMDQTEADILRGVSSLD